MSRNTPPPITRDGGRHFAGRPLALYLARPPGATLGAVYDLGAAIERRVDEMAVDVGERRAWLDAWAADLEGASRPADPVLARLWDAVRRDRLQLQPLLDLIEGGRRRLDHRQPANFGELMAVARLSGIPYARQYLHLKGIHDPQALARGDALGSALWLLDRLLATAPEATGQGRVTLPADEMERFGVAHDELCRGHQSPALRRLLRHQFQRALGPLNAGAVLGRELGPLRGLVLRMVVLRAWQRSQRFQQQGDLAESPRLQPNDWIKVVSHALRNAW